MKRILSIFLCCISLLWLTACKANENVAASSANETSVVYHIIKRQMEHDTGDINLTTYEYNDEWVIQSTTTYLNGDISSGVEYSYNEDSSVVTIKTTSSIYDATVSEMHQDFDASGKVLRATSYRDGNLEGSTEYTYDTEGREIKLVTRDSGGTIITTLLYEYDKKGNLMSYIIEQPAYSSKQEHSYNKQNRIITTKVFRNDELTNQIEYTWEGNKRNGIIYNADELVQGKTVAVYDDAGNVLMEENYDALGTLQYRTCYEYAGTDGSISSGIPN